MESRSLLVHSEEWRGIGSDYKAGKICRGWFRETVINNVVWDMVSLRYSLDTQEAMSSSTFAV